MLYDHKLARDRVAQYLQNIIAPARFTPVCDLAAAVYQCAEPCRWEAAQRATYTPVARGFRWGPAWSTAWFRFSARLPAGTPVERLYALVDTNTEACLWQDGVPYHGLNRHHRCAPLDGRFLRDGAATLWVEAAANQMFGLNEWAPRVPDEEIGLLAEARLALLEPDCDGLYHDLSFGLQLVDQLETEHPRRRKLVYALNAALNALDAGDVRGTAAAAREVLAPALRQGANASATRCHAVGHAHIDTAWLWPLRETRRKCYRTFATALRNMEQYPEYRFQQSQAQLYEFVRQDHPALFEEIRRRVADGRWDAGGGCWVECDCNLVSGESLVRQILHGARFWRQHFGIEQTYLWLPDTFGYSAALPQLLVQAGMRAFFTQKISWNQFNKFPHHTFWWAGLDGTQILTHFLTADTYTANCSPKELRYGERAFKQNDRCNDWLYAYGWGDGGGGPSTEMLELLRRSTDCEELPRVQCATVRAFVDVLHADARALPTWDGELYLELHRGTLTSQARNKRANRRLELLLRDVEILHALGDRAAYPAEALDRCWKTVLLHQFHDILPGSSIGWVYEDSARDYARVEAELRELEQQGLRTWAGHVDTRGAGQPLVAVNTLPWERREVVALPADMQAEQLVAAPGGPATPVQDGCDGTGAPVRLALVGAPGLGAQAWAVGRKAGPSAELAAAQGTARALENQFLRAEFDEAGRLTRLWDKAARREVLRAGEPANQLALYEDRPNAWDAWDIDLFYLEKGRKLAEPAELELVESGPLRASLRITRSLGASRVVQFVRLGCTARRLDFETQVHWHADHQLLRVLFPVDVRSAQASYHTQFGVLQRPTHFNNSWDWARFEVCGHHWCDLSEPDYGAALLSDCKYGYSCHGHVLGLSLLRAPTSPDPQADRGLHQFTYSLLPHVGGPAAGAVIEAGYELNVPLRVVGGHASAGVGAGRAPGAARLSTLRPGEGGLLLETVKQAEDGQQLIVRLHEVLGRRSSALLEWDPAWGSARFVDLLERGAAPLQPEVLGSAAGRIEWRTRPYGIYTLAIG